MIKRISDIFLIVTITETDNYMLTFNVTIFWIVSFVLIITRTKIIVIIFAVMKKYIKLLAKTA